jgi:hypothetical protein
MLLTETGAPDADGVPVEAFVEVFDLLLPHAAKPSAAAVIATALSDNTFGVFMLGTTISRRWRDWISATQWISLGRRPPRKQPAWAALAGWPMPGARCNPQTGAYS